MSINKNLLSWVLLFILHSLPSSHAQENFLSQQKLELIDNEIKTTIAKENIPAISIAFVTNEDQTYFLNYGHFDRSQKRIVDENSLFQIASLGKMFIGIIANNLINEGVIQPDQAITDFLHHPMNKRTFKKLNSITIQDLLHHNSGVPGDGKYGYRRKDGDPYQYNYSEIDFENELRKIRLTKKGKYKYSNLGFALAAFIFEKASNKTYEELLQKYIAIPYGLESTHLELPDNKQKNVVTPYRKYEPTIKTEEWNMGKLGPPSAVYSSTNDLQKIMAQQIKAYQDLPRSKKHALVLTNNLTIKSEKYQIYYGYGLVQWTPEIFGHTGEMDSFGSDYTFIPNKNYGVVILTSCAGNWLPNLARKIHKIIKE